MDQPTDAKPLAIKFGPLAFWTIMGVVEWFYHPSTVLGRLFHGAMLVMASSFATFSAVGLIARCVSGRGTPKTDL